MKLRPIFALACLLTASISAYAAEFYVRESCAYNGDGTTSYCALSTGAPGAWKGFNNIRWASVAPGDTLGLVSGETYAPPLAIGASGTAASPITITVLGGGTASIECANTVGCVGIRFNGRSYVTVDGVLGDAAGGDLTYGLRVINIASGASNSYCVYENSGARRGRVLHVECRGSSQTQPDDNGGGMYIGAAGVGAGGWELAYNWVHSDRTPVQINNIVQSGTLATVTTAAPHGYPTSGTYIIGIKRSTVSGYAGTRWVARTVDASRFTYSCDTQGACLPSGLASAAGGEVIWHWYATGITLFASDGSTNFDSSAVHHNTVEDLFNDGIRCGSNCSIHDNVARHIEGSGHSDSLLIQSGGYAQVYNNYVEDSADQNIYIDNLYDSTCAHIRIYNNVINSDPGFGVVLDPEGGAGAATAASTCTSGSASALDDVVILNNTFAATSASAIRKGRSKAVSNLVIKNNIFGPVTGGGYTATDLHNSISATFLDANAWDYDVFAGTSTTALSNYGGSLKTLSQLRALTPAREANGRLGSPLYVNPSTEDFRLSFSDTVARGRGVNLLSTYPFLAFDCDGAPRPVSGAWDVGAYHYQATDTLPPAPPKNLR